MIEIVGVRFKKVGKIYYFDPNSVKIDKGQNVIVETARGIEYGEVVVSNREVTEKDIVAPLKKVTRLATSDDDRIMAQNIQKQKEAFSVCQEKIKKHSLIMNLIDVEYTFDMNKILFYFTADGRVDFRELVKDLAAIFKTRIELRQIGVRDEAKMLGGVGICGKPFCCATFLGEFEPVSIKMAKEQSLSLNPTKISGSCGRLMCCLKYEQDAYEELIRITPKVDAIVDTPMGQGIVLHANILKGTLKVRVDSKDENIIKYFNVSEVKIIRNPVEKIDEKVLKALKALEE